MHGVTLVNCFTLVLPICFLLYIRDISIKKINGLLAAGIKYDSTFNCTFQLTIVFSISIDSTTAVRKLRGS